MHQAMTPLARHVWETRYRQADERFVEDSWQRVARAVAQVERDVGDWTARFREILEDFRCLPGGRILAGAGAAYEASLFNCSVMGDIEDSMDGIFDALREGALTLQSGGGIGYDFSTLRPAGFPAERRGTLASGPVSFMRVWDSMCATLVSTGSRRGAMMATLRCDHPDIESFVEAKREPGQLRHFNLSVQVDDSFMRAVAADGPWALVFPDPQRRRGAAQSVVRDWPGHREPVACAVVRTVSARALWERITRAAYDPMTRPSRACCSSTASTA
ncbi:ribonucleotide reductase N-terminal alpha domain-containing protein [Acidihalobacter aeolianus]|uniref:ribonucleotide reductase N-terminal alpha domain-containing protein n=1 Tax=Acidihalobacter aeolianus TaxID=2792603 RepID=UPI000AEE9D51|nr:ribonucleotide reductase N-terminal alpha domain-containing protein [Acidihalobacter aeolianus]